MGEIEEKNKLYRDAIYWHLIAQGYTEFQAKIEADKRASQRKPI